MSRYLTFPGTREKLTPGLMRAYREECKSYPDAMIEVDVTSRRYCNGAPHRAWRSNKFFAQLFNENGHYRLTVNLAAINTANGRWKDGITWDQLQRVKSECGFGDAYAVELFPPDNNVVNVANMRHLWLLKRRPEYAWREKGAGK